MDKGKNITSIDGGIIVTNSDELAELIKIELTHLETSGISNLILYVLKLIIYSVFLHPNLYWIPDHIPFLKLGKTIYSTDYPLATYSNLLASIGNELFSKLDQITDIRVSNALKIEQFILNHKKICKIKDSINSKPVFLRYPVLVSDQSIRDRLIRRFRKSGIGATGSYPSSLAEIEAIKPHTIVNLHEISGGIKTSQSILTIPTHSFLNQSDLTNIKSILSEFDN